MDIHENSPWKFEKLIRFDKGVKQEGCSLIEQAQAYARRDSEDIANVESFPLDANCYYGRAFRNLCVLLLPCGLPPDIREVTDFRLQCLLNDCQTRFLTDIYSFQC